MVTILRPIKGEIRLTSHCVAQYRYRSVPNLNYTDAREHLAQRVRAATVSPKPGWLVTSNQDSIGYVVLDDDIAIPLRNDRQLPGRLVAVTCLFRYL